MGLSPKSVAANVFGCGKNARSIMNKYRQGSLSSPLCSISLGSMTEAIKARRYLSSRSIEVKVRKISEGNGARGCVYGIEYPCSVSGNVYALLREGNFVRSR